jgi:hypothetical protein
MRDERLGVFTLANGPPLLLLTAFMVLIAPGAADSEMITFVFEGFIEEIHGAETGVESGDAFSGGYTFESDVEPFCYTKLSPLNNLTCRYLQNRPPFGARVQLPDVVIQTNVDNPEFGIYVRDGGKVSDTDSYFFVSNNNSVEGASIQVEHMGWTLSVSPGHFSNADLPTSLFLDEWTENYLRITTGCYRCGEEGAFTIVGTVTSLARIVTIDIKPSSDINAINPMGQGIVPVAVFGSPTFDVVDVDATTIGFGPDAAPLAHRSGPHFEDLDEDGYGDLLAHFRVQDTGIAVGDTEACFTAGLVDGSEIEGCDIVHTKPERGGGG